MTNALIRCRHRKPKLKRRPSPRQFHPEGYPVKARLYRAARCAGHYVWIGKRQRLARVLQQHPSCDALLLVVGPRTLRFSFDRHPTCDPYEGIPVRIAKDRRGPIQIYLPVDLDIRVGRKPVGLLGKAVRTPDCLTVTLSASKEFPDA